MKNKFNWRSESGVSQLGIILGIMIAGGVAGKFALDRSNEVSQVHQLAKSNNTRSIYQESIVSSLGISKVLFKPNNGEPAIYAENYFANDWNLLENTVVASKQWKLEGNDIKIIAPNPASADFDSFFKGKKDTVSLDNNVKLVELIVDNAPPFEFRHKAIVEATVIGSDKRPMKINAMIDLPEPPDPSIAISGAPPTTYDSPFTGPKVKVDINVKGIASSGKVYLNGQQIEILDMSQSRNHKSEFLAGSLNLDNRDNSRVVKVGVCEWKEPSEEPV